MKIIVIGGGKVGYYLVKTLIEHGHEPSLIDNDKETCQFIANDLDIPIICGDGTEIEILDGADTASADALISVTGKDENNLIACQLAKKLFKVKKTVARVNNPKNADAMRQLGIDITVSSTDSIARLLEREVDTSAIKQLISLNRGEASISEIQIPDNYKMNGKRLSEIRMPEQSIIVSITRDREVIIPRGNTQILSNDKVLIMTKDTAIHDVNEVLKLSN